jgi:hypothetical protein
MSGDRIAPDDTDWHVLVEAVEANGTRGVLVERDETTP